MTDPLWILTPHSVEQVQAVVQWAPTGDANVDFDAWCDFLYGDHDCHESYPVMCFYRVRWAAPDYRERSEREQVGKTLKPGQWLVRHLDNTVTVHDTDPRIQVEWGRWRVHLRGDANDYRDFDNQAIARSWLSKRQGDTLHALPVWSFTINDRAYTLTGDWEVVE